MTIIVFLVDTSASMQQKAFVSGRSTLLDVAKGAVEFFVKMRQKSPESRGDRYMLLTFEEYPKNIKAGWKENLQTFMSELKNLEASGMTTMGSALKQVFDILNVNRMQTGIDMYGQGRHPFYLEPAVIVVISDGGKLTTQAMVQSDLNLPMHSSVPGSELTREPFRWDQRLYALVLRMAGTPPVVSGDGHVRADDSPIDAMCEVTGGRSYAVTSQRVLHQCIDSLVQKLQSGVVIHFEKVGPEPPPIQKSEFQSADDETSLTRADTLTMDEVEALPVKGKDGSNPSRPHTPNPILAPSNTEWHSCRRLIYVLRSAQKGFAVGFWPIPEAFWPDTGSPALPQRSAHPNIKFTCTNQEPMIIDNLPFDKYELEPSPLTLYILARKQPKVCWQVYVQGSSKGGSNDVGHPFGYLKASTNLLSVNLFVLPYNYPVLLPLLDELFKVHRLKPTSEWRAQFHTYLRTMPAYYSGPLRRVLTRMGAGSLPTTLIPETMDNCLSYSVLNYLKRLKIQAKNEYDKTLNSTPVPRNRGIPEGIKVVPRSPFKKQLLTNNLLKDKFSLLREQLTDFPGFLLGIRDVTNLNKTTNNRFRNPFDIPRKDLLDQIVRMRSNYLQPSVSNTKLMDEDSRHCLPIGQMGNYQDYLKKMPVPLREIESTPVRQHMFGNPFKINKNMIMDEVVLDEVSLNQGPNLGLQGVNGSPGGGNSGGAQNRAQKRQAEGLVLSVQQGLMKRSRKGPLPRDFVYKKTPPGTPIHIPSFVQDEVKLPEPVVPVLTPPTSPAPDSDIPSDMDLDDDSENELVIKEEETVVDVPSSPPPVSQLPRQDAPKSSSPFDPVRAEIVAAITSPVPDFKPLVKVEEKEKVQNHSKSNGSVNGANNGNLLLVNGKVSRSGRDDSPVPPSYSRPRSNSNPQKQQKDLANESLGNNSDVQLSKDNLRSIQLRNQNMRQIIFKEVKRPGRNHEKLLQMLKDLHGPPQVRREYIKEVILEAGRFKRKSLADLLEGRMEELVSNL